MPWSDLPCPCHVRAKEERCKVPYTEGCGKRICATSAAPPGSWGGSLWPGRGCDLHIVSLFFTPSDLSCRSSCKLSPCSSVLDDISLYCTIGRFTGLTVCCTESLPSTSAEEWRPLKHFLLYSAPRSWSKTASLGRSYTIALALTRLYRPPSTFTILRGINLSMGFLLTSHSSDLASEPSPVNALIDSH